MTDRGMLPENSVPPIRTPSATSAKPIIPSRGRMHPLRSCGRPTPASCVIHRDHATGRISRDMERRRHRGEDRSPPGREKGRPSPQERTAPRTHPTAVHPDRGPASADAEPLEDPGRGRGGRQLRMVKHGITSFPLLKPEKEYGRRAGGFPAPSSDATVA
jgi:hypothetical protein